MATPSPRPPPPAGESPESGRALRSSVAAAASRVVSPAPPLPSLDSGGLAPGGADSGGSLGGASRTPDQLAPPQRAAALVAPVAQPADGGMCPTQSVEDFLPELTTAGAGRGRGRPRGASGPPRSSAPPGRAPAAAAARPSESWGRLQNGDDWCLSDTGDSYEDPDEEGRMQLAARALPAPARPTQQGPGQGHGPDYDPATPGAPPRSTGSGRCSRPRRAGPL